MPPQRQLKNHPKIVNMIEASVADLPGGVDGSKGYEIYILMEWCQGQTPWLRIPCRAH